MKVLCFILFFSSVVSAGWEGTVNAGWVEGTPKFGKSVFRVELALNGEIRGTCSAVVFEIDPKGSAYALTAAHCVTHSPSDSFDLTVDRRHATVEQSNMLLDIAILRFKAKDNMLALPFAKESPLPGSEVAIAGYPFGIEEIAYQYGHVAQSHNKETQDLWVDGRIIFGDSGGALVDPLGQLVGLTTHLYSAGPADMGGAVRIEAIQDFVEDYKEKREERKKGKD